MQDVWKVFRQECIAVSDVAILTNSRKNAPPNPAYSYKKIYIVSTEKVIKGLKISKEQGVKKLTLEQFIQIFGLRNRNSAIIPLGKLTKEGVVKVNFRIRD